MVFGGHHGGQKAVTVTLTVMMDACVNVVCQFFLQGTYEHLFRRLSAFWSSDFVHKTFQVLLSSHLQNEHLHACWGLIKARCAIKGESIRKWSMCKPWEKTAEMVGAHGSQCPSIIHNSRAPMGKQLVVSIRTNELPPAHPTS
jgi:hypothetical protein